MEQSNDRIKNHMKDLQYKDEVKHVKVLVGMFHEEVKSNSLTDFVVWVECKLELDYKRNIEMSKLRRK